MALFTCDNCNYTFSSHSKPDACPDCGKRVATRMVSNGSYTTKTTIPAIRPASDMESLWFRRVQAELELEDQQAQGDAYRHASAQMPA